MKFLSFCCPAVGALPILSSFLFILPLPISQTLLVPHLPWFLLCNNSGLCGVFLGSCQRIIMPH